MRYWRNAVLVTLLCAIFFPAGAAAQQLAITSPSAGTVIAPGQTLAVTVTVASGSVLGVMVSAQDIGATALQGAAPYSFSLVIPQGIAGLKNLTAFGFTAAEQAVTSAVVQIDVEPSAAATGLAASIQHIQFGYAGDQFPLGVTATFTGGSQLDVTGSTRTMFSSGDTTVATVDATGLVTATGAGTTSISVTYTGRTASVQVSVPTKVAGDLNGDGKVTADDLRTLEAFVGSNAVGPFDARDLNGDGTIDAGDVQILQNLCGAACSNLVSVTATLLASSANPSTSGQSVKFTATVSPAGITTPTGSVKFLDGGAQLGAGNLGNTGAATFQTAALQPGTHSITAQYGGDTDSNPSVSGILKQVVNGTASATAVGSSLNPSIVGQAVVFTATVTGVGGTPTGSVTFYDTATSLGSMALSAGQAMLNTSALAIGSHSITAQYGGDSTFSGSTSAPALNQVVNGKASATALASSLSSEVGGQSVTFTATVTSVAGGTPTGMVTFYNGATALGPAPVALNGSGVASLSTTALAVGSPSINASYGGDANYSASMSPAVTETVNEAGFGPAPASLMVPAGQSIPINLTAYVANGYNLTFTWSCVGVPAKSSCTFNQNPLAPGPPPNGTTFQFMFGTASSESPGPWRERSPWPWGTLGILVASAALLGASLIRWKHAPRRRLAFGSCAAVIVLAALAAGCATPASPPSYTGTPKGPATFTVMGSAGAVTISAQVSVTVQ